MPDVREVMAALSALRRAEAASDAAYEAKRAAEQRLAEVMSVGRRDKDMGFEAEFEAQRFIIDHALAGDFDRYRDVCAEGLARLKIMLRNEGLDDAEQVVEDLRNHLLGFPALSESRRSGGEA